jgi:hypothetical protein
VLGSLLVLGGIGYGVYLLLGGGKAPTPAGWQEYTYREDGFKAAFPSEPQVLRSGDLGAAAGNVQVPGFNADRASSSVYQCNDPAGNLNITVMVARTGVTVPGFMGGLNADLFRDAARLMPGVEVNNVTWLGENAVEWEFKDHVQRMVIKNDRMFTAIVRGKNGRATREEEQGFFDSFVAID